MTFQKLVLDVSDAMLALDAMLQAATSSEGAPIAMAVVDEYGDLMAFCRMDGTPPFVCEFARQKAYTASRMRSHSRDFVERLKSQGRSAADHGDPKLVGAAGGGAVIVRPADGIVLGGIGVSGRTGAEDDEVARIGAQAIVG